MAGIATRLTWLLVRIAFDAGQTRSLVTNILGRQQGVTQPVLKTLMDSSNRSAKANIMRRTPQISQLISSVEQWMTEESRGEKDKKSPDGKQEDTRRDLYLWQITEQTMLTLEERLHVHVPFTAVEHNDHTGNRHVHLLACLKGRIEKADLKALRDSATEAALAQRQERDLAREEKARAIEEAQWAY